MTELFTQGNAYLNEITNGNEFLISLIVMSLIASATLLARYTPKAIYIFTKRNFTTSFTINNTSYQENSVMSILQSFIQRQITETSSRTLSFNVKTWFFDDKDVDDMYSSVGLGYGFHWFFYGGRLFWCHKKKLESSGSEIQKNEITLFTFGRSHKPIIDLITSLIPSNGIKDGIRVYTPTKDAGWEVSDVIKKRSVDSIAIEDVKKSQLMDSITNFKNNHEWFDRANLPYKFSTILHGVPGTGKTSIIKSIASEFNMNLCILNLHDMSDDKLQKLLSRIPKNSVLAIEDFESSGAVSNRGISVNPDNSPETNDKSLGFEAFSCLTLTGVLNTLDGLVPLNDVILFMTTNDLKSVDEAVYRDGRIDLVLEIGKISDKEIRPIVQKLFPEEDLTMFYFKECVGSKINKASMICGGDFNKFIEALEDENLIETRNENGKIYSISN